MNSIYSFNKQSAMFVVPAMSPALIQILGIQNKKSKTKQYLFFFWPCGMWDLSSLTRD